MPEVANPTTLNDSLLDFPHAYRENGCFTSPSNNDESFSISQGALPQDRISFWKVHCHDKSANPFPILGISSSQLGDKQASYLDPSFFGWRADASSWQGGKVVREGAEWIGFKRRQQMVFRYDPVSSPKSHFLSVQVVDTDIEATMLVPAPPSQGDRDGERDGEYRISMTLNEGAHVTLSPASIVDVRYWEIQQELLDASSSKK